jgi:hypothetical protein
LENIGKAEGQMHLVVKKSFKIDSKAVRLEVEATGNR